MTNTKVAVPETHPASTVSFENRIRTRAYELYELRGRGDGHALDDWLQAEVEMQPVAQSRVTAAA